MLTDSLHLLIQQAFYHLKQHPTPSFFLKFLEFDVVKPMLADRVYQLLALRAKNTFYLLLMTLLKSGIHKHYSEFIFPGDLVFDVGVNIGEITNILGTESEACWRRSSIILPKGS